jgi:hypothetical protein
VVLRKRSLSPKCVCCVKADLEEWKLRLIVASGKFHSFKQGVEKFTIYRFMNLIHFLIGIASENWDKICSQIDLPNNDPKKKNCQR